MTCMYSKVNMKTDINRGLIKTTANGYFYLGPLHVYFANPTFECAYILFRTLFLIENYRRI